MKHSTIIKEIGSLTIPDPEFGDVKLSVFPFTHDGGDIKLPYGFEPWEETLNAVMANVPVHDTIKQHFVTIDSKFFTNDEFLRREGVHMDGNFCVDPNFTSEEGIFKASWGGAQPKPSWAGLTLDNNGHVKMDWVLPYPDVIIPIGDYVSDTKGGIFCVSSEVGCQGWDGEFYGEVGGEGDYSAMNVQLTEDRKVVFDKNTLHFMTSNTPHETLLISKGKRRTFMRVTLDNEYPNDLILKRNSYRVNDVMSRDNTVSYLTWVIDAMRGENYWDVLLAKFKGIRSRLNLDYDFVDEEVVETKD